MSKSKRKKSVVKRISEERLAALEKVIEQERKELKLPAYAEFDGPAAKNLIKKLGLRVGDVAEEVGIHITTLSSWLTGFRKLPESKRENLHILLKTKLSEIIAK